MSFLRTSVAAMTAAIGIAAAATAIAAPAQADPTDAVTNMLGAAGMPDVDPATAVAVGQSVCPMLEQPGQDMANVASGVADSLGKPLGPATMFTGLAIKMFCPGAVASLANGQNPLPFGLPGM
jgi:hypothetical protein